MVPAVGEHRAEPRHWLDFAVPAALVGATAATRLPRLDTPAAFVFDEIYYALDGADLLRHGVEQGGVVHPPLAKWLIAAGIRVGGFTPTGWRLGALVCGCLVVLLTYLCARQLVAGRTLPALAGGLVALDGISFTTGRAALIDVFLALFTTAALLFTLTAFRHGHDARRVARCEWAVALCLGLGLATKWSALWVLLGCMLAFLVLHGSGPRRAHQGRAVLASVLRLGLVPLGVYLAAYGPWFVNFDRTYIHLHECERRDDCGTSFVDRARLFAKDHKRVYDFQIGLRSTDNTSAAPAYTWANQNQPSTLYRKRCLEGMQEVPPQLDDRACAGAGADETAEIIAVANPVVWFVGEAAAVVALGWMAIARRNLPSVVLLVFVATLWAPWALNPRHSYTFYLAPVIPVFALLTAVVLSRRRLRSLGPVVAVAAVAAFAFYYPIWSGVPLSPDAVRAREYWRAY
ncbi:MAG: phospholipid carrier-dependent glycosyltransferase [Acidimicrobiia bacterium]